MTDKEIILKALQEYEENNYMNYDNEWQENINRLISEYKKGE